MLILNKINRGSSVQKCQVQWWYKGPLVDFTSNMKDFSYT